MSEYDFLREWLSVYLLVPILQVLGLAGVLFHPEYERGPYLTKLLMVGPAAGAVLTIFLIVTWLYYHP